MTEVIRTSETSVYFSETSGHCPDGGNMNLWNVGLLQRDSRTLPWGWRYFEPLKLLSTLFIQRDCKATIFIFAAMRTWNLVQSPRSFNFILSVILNYALDGVWVEKTSWSGFLLEKFNTQRSIMCSQKLTERFIREGSSVSIVSGYVLDHRAIEVRSPAEAKVFFL
jgi:hypothetical protein